MTLVGFTQMPQVRVIRVWRPECSDTRRQITEFLQRERAQELIAAAFELPAGLLGVPAVKVSPGR